MPKACLRPDRLRGRQRFGIVGAYRRGLINAAEAGRLLGMSARTVMRSVAADFDWDAARARYLERLARRYREREP